MLDDRTKVRGDASGSAMALGLRLDARLCQTRGDASVSAMTPEPTHPNMKARQYRI